MRPSPEPKGGTCLGRWLLGAQSSHVLPASSKVQELRVSAKRVKCRLCGRGVP